jgi:hypothetical protein
MAEAPNGAGPTRKAQPIAGAKISKQEAVRRALSKLGKKAKPKAIQAWIKDHLHLDMTTDHISTTKSQLLKAQKKSASSKPAASAAPPASVVAALPEVKPASEKGVAMEDILTLKELLQRVGAGPLRTLIAVLSI